MPKLICWNNISILSTILKRIMQAEILTDVLSVLCSNIIIKNYSKMHKIITVFQLKSLW